MRVLVTGAAGFIGSTTAELLLTRGHDVVAIDNLSKGQPTNVPTAATFIEGDCGDEELIFSLGNFDACVHFAGRIEPAQSVTHPEEFMVNNVGSTFALTRALVRVGVERFVFSSSAAIYGDQVDMPIKEDCSPAPASPYGLTKRMVEEGLHCLAESKKLRAASLRYFNAAGGTTAHPESHDPETHLIPSALDVVLGARDNFELFGDDYPTPDGTCIRDYVHVLDLAEAHILAIEALDTVQEVVVNLGSGIGFSNREVLDAIRRVTGTDFDIRVSRRRPGDPAVAVADTSRASSLLGWHPTHSDLDNMVGDAWSARQSLHRVNSRIQ